MEISYKNKKLEKQLTEPKELQKKFGELARKIKQRLQELSAAENLAVMRTIPAARCHELKGSREGELAVDVSVNYRIIFQPNQEPIPLKEDGGLDWEAVIKVQINEITDYH